MFLIVLLCSAGLCAGPVYARESILVPSIKAPSKPYTKAPIKVEGKIIAQPETVAKLPALGPVESLYLPVTQNDSQKLAPVMPPTMPSSLSWKGVDKISQEKDIDIDKSFIDDYKHWKHLDDVKYKLNDFYKVKVDEKNPASPCIRFSLLPRPEVHSIDDVKISKPKKSFYKVVAKKTDAKKAKLDKQDCRVYNKARKKQLDAIESDRLTLVALREAMKELGLVKKLSLVAGGAQTFPKQKESSKFKP